MSKEYINNEIILNYATEDINSLAKRLGISISNLRKKANRLNVKRRKETITNLIVDNTKLCPKCSKIKHISSFNKDKHQPSSYDYWCRDCRHNAKNSSVTLNNVNNSINSSSMAFGIKKTRNPIIIVENEYGESIKCLKCKGNFCNNSIKPLKEFYKDKTTINGYKNVCKYCISKKHKSNK